MVTAALASAGPVRAPLEVVAEAGSAVPDGLAEHWLLVTIVGVAALGLATALAILARWIRIAMNIFLDESLPAMASHQDYDPPRGEIVWFMGRDGRRLRGMFVDRPPGRPDRGTILFCHEFGSDMFSAGRYAWPLINAGFTVFTFDFRGHGKSPLPPNREVRHWPSHHEVDDVLAALAYVRERRNTEERGLGILGISRGASAATVAAVLNPDVRRLALDSVYSTDYSCQMLIVRWAEIFTRLRTRGQRRPSLLLRFVANLMFLYVELKLRCRFPSARKALGLLEHIPVLFIGGERDAYVRPQHVRDLYRMKAGEKDLWICPRAKHNQAVATDPDTYATKLLEFFDDHLVPEPRTAETAGRPPHGTTG